MRQYQLSAADYGRQMLKAAVWNERTGFTSITSAEKAHRLMGEFLHCSPVSGDHMKYIGAHLVYLSVYCDRGAAYDAIKHTWRLGEYVACFPYNAKITRGLKPDEAVNAGEKLQFLAVAAGILNVLTPRIGSLAVPGQIRKRMLRRAYELI